MAEQENGAAAQESQVKMKTLTQFVRDLSFENILAQRGTGGTVEPDVTVAVNLDAKKRSVEHQYEVRLKLNITSKNKSDDQPLFFEQPFIEGDEFGQTLKRCGSLQNQFFHDSFFLL